MPPHFVLEELERVHETARAHQEARHEREDVDALPVRKGLTLSPAAAHRHPLHHQDCANPRKAGHTKPNRDPSSPRTVDVENVLGDERDVAQLGDLLIRPEPVQWRRHQTRPGLPPGRLGFKYL